MKCCTRIIIYIFYHYAQLLGMLPYTYNKNINRLCNKFWITLYSATITLIISTSSILLLYTNLLEMNEFRDAQLHNALLKINGVLRTITVIMIIIQKWHKRHIICELFNYLLDTSKIIMTMTITMRSFYFYRHHQLEQNQKLGGDQQQQQQSGQYPSKATLRYFEKCIWVKAICSILGNICDIVFNFSKVQQFGYNDATLKALNRSILNIVVNMNVTLFYFTLAQINTLLMNINGHLKRILMECQILFDCQKQCSIRPAILMTACCRLADQLDALTIRHYNLRTMAKINHRLHQLHAIFIILILYINNVVIMYTCCMAYAGINLHENYTDAPWYLFLMAAHLCVYYIDLKVFLEAILDFGDFIHITIDLLNVRQSWPPTLDARLEHTLDKFSLELITFPMELKLLGLFELNRPMCFTIFSSTVAYSIVMTQYDYQTIIKQYNGSKI